MFLHRYGRFVFYLALVFQLAPALAGPTPTTPAEIIAAIDKQHILEPGARVTARVDNQQALISTYRHYKANEQDLKIDAILMAKTVTALDPGITRVRVFFFSSTNLNRYNQIDVTSVDIKAFASGEVGKEELLSSIQVTPGEIEDPAKKINNALEASEFMPGRRVNTVIKDKEIEVTTDLDSLATDGDIKYSALRMAKQALAAATPQEIRSIKIAFLDPSKGGLSRIVMFVPNLIRSLDASIQAALSPIAVIQAGANGDLADLRAYPGILQEERQKLLDRIKDLQKHGVGIAPFVTAFKSIEEQIVASSSDEAKVSDAIKHLNESIDAQENASKDAKSKTTANIAPIAPPSKSNSAPVTRWVLGFECLNDAHILADPQGYITAVEQKVNAYDARQKIRAEDDPKFAGALRYFVQVLSTENRLSDIGKINQRLNQIRLKHPNF
ncbi:MAG: hypothetical protein C5B53_04470 [Candidatus Melainabacteria bacterium]|nr:MAG: hypothetical protein C5B53_04470 [Candidatus Melainabacteria bacterium]